MLHRFNQTCEMKIFLVSAIRNFSSFNFSTVVNHVSFIVRFTNIHTFSFTHAMINFLKFAISRFKLQNTFKIAWNGIIWKYIIKSRTIIYHLQLVHHFISLLKFVAHFFFQLVLLFFLSLHFDSLNFREKYGKGIEKWIFKN